MTDLLLVENLFFISFLTLFWSLIKGLTELLFGLFIISFTDEFLKKAIK
jgi:hypothetical protein